MRFERHGRYQFTDTPRKRAAYFAKQRREREAQPLFAEQIAEEQATRPGVDEVMRQRAEGFAKGEQRDRDYRAQKWREGRKKLFQYGDNTRTVVRQLWDECPYPATPSYFLTMLHDIEKGRIPLDANPPWCPTEEEIRIGRENIARYVDREKERRAAKANPQQQETEL